MLSFFQQLLSQLGKREAQAPDTPRRHEASSIISVIYDEQGVSLAFEGQVRQSVEWSKIELIVIRIEDEFLPFPYWYVGNKDILLRIPNNAIGGRELFFDGFGEHISGYNSDATFKVIIEASAAMEGSFVVWRAESATAD